VNHLAVLGYTVFTQRLGDVAISKTTYDPSMIMESHVHDRAYVSFVVEGHYTEHCAGSPRHLHGNMLVYHPAGEVHADYVHDQSMATINLEYACADLPGEFFCAEGPDVDALTSRFLSALPSSGPALRRSIDVIREFLRARVRRAAPPEQMMLARKTLRDANRRRAVSALAYELGIHRVQLHRAFRRAYGESPRRDALNARLAVAAKMLTTSKASIAAVAAECGYFDQSHFCRQFRRLTGVAPSTYRKVFANG
jgi:AraC family transcriptional regulator